MLILLTFTWILCLTVLIIFVRRNPMLNMSIGLVYLFALTFGHILGAIIYLDPSYIPAADPYLRSKGTLRIQTVVGFQAATQFVIAYLISYVSFISIFGRHKKRIVRKFSLEIIQDRTRFFLRSKLISLFRKIFATGLIFYTIYFAVEVVKIPSVSQIFAQGPLILVSSSMIAEFAFGLGYELLIYIGLLSLLILLIQGFLSYSIAFIVMIAAILVSYKKLRKIYFLYSTLTICLGLLALKSWLVSREVIRQFLFNGQSLNVGVLKEFLISFFENLIISSDFDYQSISIAIDTRLNLNNILGRTVINWSPETAIHSINQIYIGFIPRAIWPAKPSLSSNTEWVSQLTKMSFSEGVSVGLGHISELYGNYGNNGLLIGAILIAFLFSVIDIRLNIALAKYRILEAWGILMVGLSLVEPGKIFVKAVNASVITAVAYFIIILILKWSKSSNKRAVQLYF